MAVLKNKFQSLNASVAKKKWINITSMLGNLIL